MAQVITFESFRPVARYDSIPWTQARIEEGASEDGAWVTLETIALSPVDANPQIPAARNFTTELADDAMGLWYRIVFLDATGDSLAPTEPIQNLEAEATTGATYGNVTELARRLKIRQATAEQTDEMERVLLEATLEIDAEIDLADDVELTTAQLALATGVNYDRAVELWAMSPFGIIGLGSESVGMYASKNSWEAYAHRLAPLKNQWGIS